MVQLWYMGGSMYHSVGGLSGATFLKNMKFPSVAAINCSSAKGDTSQIPPTYSEILECLILDI